jgi:Fic family protein
METAIVLEKGITVSGKPLKDHLEAIGHKEAIDYIRLLAGKQEPIREGDIRSIHKLVLGRTSSDDAGAYSSHQRAIAGSLVRFPSPAEIGPMMRDFAGWLGKTASGYKQAFEAHYRLVSIHPFSDGNGRTARLLMNLMLMRGGYSPVVIGPEDRLAYLSALETKQLGLDAAPYQQFMENRLLVSLTSYVEQIRRGEPENSPKPGR